MRYWARWARCQVQARIRAVRLWWRHGKAPVPLILVIMLVTDPRVLLEMWGKGLRLQRCICGGIALASRHHDTTECLGGPPGGHGRL